MMVAYIPEYCSGLLLGDIKRSMEYLDFCFEDLAEIFPQDIKLTEKTQPLVIIADSIKEEIEKATRIIEKAKKLAQQLYSNINLLEEDNNGRS